MANENVYLACPVYGGAMDFFAAKSVWMTSSKSRMMRVESAGSSLLARNCNTLWCDALNLRTAENLKWFAMLHSDVAPEPWWLDRLIEEAESKGADLLSVVVPMKSAHGVTSTAISTPGNRYQYFCRITTQQIRHPSFPNTFGIREAADALENLPPELRIANVPREALLVNTGCMVCRLDRPWATKVWFENEDRIANVNGQWRAVGVSEDWNFSWQVAQQGGKVMATRMIEVIHRGTADYSSQSVWGQARDLG